MNINLFKGRDGFSSSLDNNLNDLEKALHLLSESAKQYQSLASRLNEFDDGIMSAQQASFASEVYETTSKIASNRKTLFEVLENLQTLSKKFEKAIFFAIYVGSSTGVVGGIGVFYFIRDIDFYATARALGLTEILGGIALYLSVLSITLIGLRNFVTDIIQVINRRKKLKNLYSTAFAVEKIIDESEVIFARKRGLAP